MIRRLLPLILALALLVVSAAMVLRQGGPAAATPTPQPRETLVVFAAASLTDAFNEMGSQFESAHPGTTITFNFAGSQQLRAQLEQGAEADVFAAADSQEMAEAVDGGLVTPGAAQVFARNRLIAIFPRDNPAGIESLADLTRPGVKLVVAGETVPAGRYTLAMLNSLAQDPAYGPVFRDAVLKNVVSQEQNVRAVANKVALGEADAGIVYASDVSAVADKVGALLVPDPYNPQVSYLAAPLATSRQGTLAAQFVAWLSDDVAQAALADRGFTPAAQ